MPAEAVALDVILLGINNDEIDDIRGILSKFEFHPHPIDDQIIGDTINYQPFEHTEEKVELVKECVSEISTSIPDADVSYEIRKNRDAGRTVEKVCNIRVDAKSDEEKEEKRAKMEERRKEFKEKRDTGHWNEN